MATFFVRSGASGAGTGASWTDAFTSISSYATGTVTDGDIIWIADDHNENFAPSGFTSWFLGTAGLTPMYFLCADHTVASPTSADLKTTARIRISNTTGREMARRAYWYGVEILQDPGSAFTWATHNGSYVFERCKFYANGSSNNINAFSHQNTVKFINCDVDMVTFSPSNVNHTIGQGSNPFLTWQGGALITAATYNDPPFSSFSQAHLYGVDLSACDPNIKLFSRDALNNGNILLEDCKFRSGQIISDRTGLYTESTCPIVVIRGDSGSGVYLNSIVGQCGALDTETTVVRTGGAVDGTTAISHKLSSVTSDGRFAWEFPFKSMKISTWNPTATGTVNVTMEGIADPTSFSALPKNDEIWFDVTCAGTTGSTLGIYTSGTKANIRATGSALTASTEDWDSLATSRANSTAYTLGQIRKVSSNSGRLFVCTTAGTSAASLPGGYATAVDGDAITDGTAVFKAMWRFKQTIAVTPKFAGALYVIPNFAKASSTVYIDPLITLS